MQICLALILKCSFSLQLYSARQRKRQRKLTSSSTLGQLTVHTAIMLECTSFVLPLLTQYCQMRNCLFYACLVCYLHLKENPLLYATTPSSRAYAHRQVSHVLFYRSLALSQSQSYLLWSSGQGSNWFNWSPLLSTLHVVVMVVVVAFWPRKRKTKTTTVSTAAATFLTVF